MVPPCEVEQVKANDAYSQLIELRARFPIGMAREVTDWKNEDRR